MAMGDAPRRTIVAWGDEADETSALPVRQSCAPITEASCGATGLPLGGLAEDGDDVFVEAGLVGDSGVGEFFEGSDDLKAALL